MKAASPTDSARCTAASRTSNVLVNNAGVGGGEVVQGSDVARWKKTIDTNLFGMYLVTRQILPLMADGGRIVNLSSVLGRFGVPGYTAYCASKHGVIGFTRALALEAREAEDHRQRDRAGLGRDRHGRARA